MSVVEIEIPAEDALGKECACGCGERLPVGSRNNYKRGHKPSAERDLVENDRSVSDIARQRTRGKRSKSKTPKGVSHETAEGVNSFVSKVLFGITLFYAWWALRVRKVPDPRGEYADRMAFTDDESVIVGRVVSRALLSTEPGRRVAPHIAGNEDLIDAAFTMFDWYKRNAEIWDELGTKGYSPPKPQVNGKVRRNGNSGEATEDRGESEIIGYVPPSTIDIIADI